MSCPHVLDSMWRGNRGVPMRLNGQSCGDTVADGDCLHQVKPTLDKILDGLERKRREMELQQRTWDMGGVRDSDEGTLEFWFNPETKSLADCVVTAFNEGGTTVLTPTCTMF